MQSVSSPNLQQEVNELAATAGEERVPRQLSFIYSQIPMNNCRRCADCCFNSPQVYPIEFINIYRSLQSLSEKTQITLGNRIVEYELLSLTTLKNKCPFLSKRGCLIYGERPLQCRLFGLYPQGEYENLVKRCRHENKNLADYYLRKKRVKLPMSVMTYDVDQCENNYDSQGNLLILPEKERERFDEQILALSEQFLPRHWRSQHLLSFSNQYNRLHTDDETLEQTKVQSIREFQRHGDSRTMKRFLARGVFKF